MMLLFDTSTVNAWSNVTKKGRLTDSWIIGLQDIENMGRSKNARPVKRQRQNDEEEAAANQAAAIEALKSIPQEDVERAAADATRDTIDDWPQMKAGAPPPSWLRGLGPSTTIPETHLSALQNLHNIILQMIPTANLSSWSGSPQDPRRRAFGFLPGTLGYNLAQTSSMSGDGILDISRPWREREILAGGDDRDESGDDDGGGKVGLKHDTDSETEERIRNERAMALLPSDQLPNGIEDAIEHVCSLFRGILLAQGKIEMKHEEDASLAANANPPLSQLADFLHYRCLVAAQPNLHNGRELLPMHLDHPKKDGFGVVIVTIGMSGAGSILLQASSSIAENDGKAGDVTTSTDKQDDNNHESIRSITMRLEPGQAYMLADRARDACIHGVLADPDAADRNSLNLRFGMHDVDCGSIIGDADNKQLEKVPRLPVVASRQVLQYWED